MGDRPEKAGKRPLASEGADWQEIRYSLRFRLLFSLFLLLGLSLLVAMVGIWTFERDRFMEYARNEAMLAGRTIEKALRGAMLENDREKIRQTVAGLQQIVAPSVISIMSPDGLVAVSNDESLVGQRFDLKADPGCLICHLRPGVMPDRGAVLLETESGPVLRNIIKIANAPECHGCHGPEQKNCGILLYDVLLSDIYATLHTLLFRIALTGLISFLVIIIALSLIIQHFVHRPLTRLQEGFLHVGRGDFNHWVEVGTRGEFQEMADQFNVMSRAIGRSLAEIRQKNWETGKLYTFVQQLSQASEWNKLKPTIVNLLFESFAADRVALFLCRENRKGMLVEISWKQAGDRRCYHREYEDAAGKGELPDWIMAELEKWRQDILASPSFLPNEITAFVPLASKGVAVGLVFLEKGSGQPFRKVDKKLLLAVSEQIGIALANARLYRMAITDGLTGLYTKGYCESVIRKILDGRSTTQESGFSVLMMDLDHFKRVNDSHGHQAGDQVLVQLARLIRANIRQDDVACRYGGEEFILLAMGSPETGVEIAARLRRAIEQHVFSCDGDLALHNTISIGVACFPQHGESGEAVISAADQALYEAKKRGRNQVVSFAGEESRRQL